MWFPPNIYHLNFFVNRGIYLGYFKETSPTDKILFSRSSWHIFILHTHLHSDTVLYSSRSNLLHILLHCFYEKLQTSSLWDQILSYCVQRVFSCIEMISQDEILKVQLQKIIIRNCLINPGGCLFAEKQEVKQRIPWLRLGSTLYIC